MKKVKLYTMKRNLVLLLICLGAYSCSETAEMPMAVTPAFEVVNNTPPKCEKAGQIWVSPMDGMELVCIPAGIFYMGSDPNIDLNMEEDEGPQHIVFLSAYWIDKTEVTNMQFSKYIEQTGGTTIAERYLGEEPIELAWRTPRGLDSSLEGLEDHPVVLLYSGEAWDYCEWAGRTLPTEAQWEKAARWDESGQVSRIFPWGDSQLDIFQINLSGDTDGYAFTAPVGVFPVDRSPYGVFDMGGNVSEWVMDLYYPNYKLDRIWGSIFFGVNPTGPGVQMADPEHGRVIKGGSWFSDIGAARSANRTFGGMTSNNFIGFRCAVPSP